MAAYTEREELANRLTHGLGAGLSVAGLVLLVVFAARHGNAWHVVSAAVYGTTLVLLYTASTLYHSFRDERHKQLLRKFDRAAIFLLIAGTYTPFVLVTLRGPWGWSLFGVVWALVGYAATRGQRDFSSVTTVVATRYEVLVEHKVAARARELLARLPGATPDPFA